MSSLYMIPLFPLDSNFCKPSDWGPFDWGPFDL